MTPLFEPVLSTDRVAADYDTIHRVSGREVLWNTVQLDLSIEERPYGWQMAWPIEAHQLDVIITRRDDPLLERLDDWRIIAETPSHLTLRSSTSETNSQPSPRTPEAVR